MSSRRDNQAGLFGLLYLATAVWALVEGRTAPGLGFLALALLGFALYGVRRSRAKREMND